MYPGRQPRQRARERQDASTGGGGHARHPLYRTITAIRLRIAWRSSRLCRSLTLHVPTLTLAPQLALRCEPRQDAVQVVRLDLHCLGKFGNRDARPAANELERLRRASATAAASRATPRLPRGATSRTAPSRTSRRRARASRTSAPAGQRGTRRLEPRDLVLELAEPLLDLSRSCVNESWQECLLSLRSSRSKHTTPVPISNGATVSAQSLACDAGALQSPSGATDVDPPRLLIGSTLGVIAGSEATVEVVVDDADVLHERVHTGRAHKAISL